MKSLFPVLALALSAEGCPRAEQRAATAPAGPAQIRRFDLVPSGYDDNGFARNPEWGWSFNQAHCRGADDSKDPTTCSWRFENDQPPSATPCNTLLVDADFSDKWSTWLLGVTCSDSPLLYPGHVNWGRAYGGAVTYEGMLSWEEYAADGDYNFVLEPKKGPAPGILIGVEIDSADFRAAESDWFHEFKDLVHRGGDVSRHVGRKWAVVTGLFGIDAEHLSARDMSVELHPVYALAVQISPPPDLAFAFFVRDQSDEGFCSHRDRAHTVRFGGSRYTFRLPLDGCASLDWGKQNVCSRTGSATSIAVALDRQKRAALVTVQVPDGGFVDGEIHYKCEGPGPGTPDAGPGPMRIKRGDHPMRSAAQIVRVVEPIDRPELAPFRNAVHPDAGCAEMIDAGFEFAPIPDSNASTPGCDGMPDPVDFARAGAVLDAGVSFARPSAGIVQKQRPKSPEKEFCEKHGNDSDAAKAFCASRQLD